MSRIVVAFDLINEMFGNVFRDFVGDKKKYELFKTNDYLMILHMSSFGNS